MLGALQFVPTGSSSIDFFFCLHHRATVSSCHRQGIVAAIRQRGGRFLELDERTGAYNDIGDKKASEHPSHVTRGTRPSSSRFFSQLSAGRESTPRSVPARRLQATEKTSQALREGGKVRRATCREELPPGGREVSAEGYFMYSSHVLASLYRAEGRREPPQKPAAYSLELLESLRRPAGAPAPAAVGGAQRACADAMAQAREQCARQRGLGGTLADPCSTDAPSFPPPSRAASAPFREPEELAPNSPSPYVRGDGIHGHGARQSDCDVPAPTREQSARAELLRRANSDVLARAREQFAGVATSSSSPAASPPPSPRPASPTPPKRATELSYLMRMSIGTLSQGQWLEEGDGDAERASVHDQLCDLVRRAQADIDVHGELSVAFDGDAAPRRDRVSDLTELQDSKGSAMEFNDSKSSTLNDSKGSMMDASIMSFGTEDMSCRPSMGRMSMGRMTWGSAAPAGSNNGEVADLLKKLDKVTELGCVDAANDLRGKPPLVATNCKDLKDLMLSSSVASLSSLYTEDMSFAQSLDKSGHDRHK